MARIEIVASGFSGSHSIVNGRTSLEVSRRSFYRASLTLGFQRFGDFWAAGPITWMYRLGLGFSSWALLENDQGNLCLSPHHANLDPSEKNVMSYWQGMVFAKLVAEDRLGIPWLAHVDDMQAKRILVSSATTKERGDFAGRGKNGHWHVIEAKGRSSQQSIGKLVQKAKHQAAQVTHAGNGQTPETNSACISCLWKNPIEAILDDPPGDSKNAVEWKINDERFWQYYYGNIVSYIRAFGFESDRQELEGFMFARLGYPFTPHFFDKLEWRDLRIGLPRSIVESPASALKTIQGLERDRNGYVGADGIAVIGAISDWPIQEHRSPVE